MLLGFFKRPLPTTISAVVLLSILLWINTLIHPSASRVLLMEPLSPLWPQLKLLMGDNVLVYLLSGFAFTFISGLYLIQLNSKYILIKFRTYLPALFYILIASGNRNFQVFSPAAISAFFVILAIDNLFSATLEGKELDRLFKAGFSTGIATLLYLPSAITLPVIYIGLSTFRSFNPRHWIATLFGYLTPWFFVYMYHFIAHNNPLFLFDVANNFWSFSLPYFSFSHTNLSYLLIIITFSLITFYRLIVSLPTQKIIIRKYYGAFIWFILLGISLVIILPVGSFEVLNLMAIPLAFIFSYYFSFIRSRFWGELLFTTIVAAAAIMQFL